MPASALSRHIVRASWGSFLLQSPLWALVNGLLPFVLFRSMGASPFEIALFTALRPATGLLAPLWTSVGLSSPHHLKLNAAAASACATLAIGLASFVGGVSAWLCGAGFYLIFMRGRQGAVAEILRTDLSEEARLRLLSRQNAVGHLLSALVPWLAGMALDAFPDCWEHLIQWGALCTALASLLQWKLFPERLRPLHQLGLRGWVSDWQETAHDTRFRNYLLGFMAAGAGLMVMAPILPSLFMDRLHLSYTQIGWAIGGCKAVGFLASTHTWVHLHRQLPLPLLNALIAALVGAFPLLLFGAHDLLWVTMAYLFYGVMQAGSELSWHNSPIHYAQGRSALPYAASSQLMQGLRGLTIPALGGWIAALYGDMIVLMMSVALAAVGSAWFGWTQILERRQAAQSTDRGSLSSQRVTMEP